ncbi:hypothetical protein [Amylibacter sp. SFDW26]|uniref:hypothetical protein n=1 Tax=Amylibacter sp. SFDW26 TaxID=2652722 RepID=UPI00186A54A1|nr:hypothetical protein [Amylibacter sp. SFDW26]
MTLSWHLKLTNVHQERRLWVAPALQVFSGDICGHVRQYCRLSGLFMFWRSLPQHPQVLPTPV